MSTSLVQTFGVSDEAQLRLQLESLSEPVDYVEIRFDLLSPRTEVASLIDSSPKPVIATLRSRDQGGGFDGSTSQRQSFFNSLVATSAKFVDLEIDDRRPASLSPQRVIRSFHDFTRVPRDGEERIAALLQEEEALAKIAVMPRDFTEAFTWIDQTQNLETQNLVRIAMGAHGRFSRIAAGWFRIPLTYAAPPGRGFLAPGQVPTADLVNLYRTPKILPDWTLALCFGFTSKDAEILDWNQKAEQESRETAFIPVPGDPAPDPSHLERMMSKFGDQKLVFYSRPGTLIHSGDPRTPMMTRPTQAFETIARLF